MPRQPSIFSITEKGENEISRFSKNPNGVFVKKEKFSLVYKTQTHPSCRCVVEIIVPCAVREDAKT